GGFGLGGGVVLTPRGTPVGAAQNFVKPEQRRVVDYDAPPYLVRHTTQSFLSGLEALEPIFSYVPDGKVNVVLQDFSDRSNAHARVEPHNRIAVAIAASNGPYETMNFGDRFEPLPVHELTHIPTLHRPTPPTPPLPRLS